MKLKNLDTILKIVIAVFAIIIIVYLFQIDYELPLLSDENKPFTIGGMFAIIGLVFTVIILQLNTLSIGQKGANQADKS